MRTSDSLISAAPLWRRAGAGIVAALASILVLGTVAAVWPNPFFIRMVPTKGYEIPLLLTQSSLFGVYVMVRRPACGLRRMGFASAINFLGVACPICNKVLLLIFGATALMTYFEPVRLYVGILGTGLGVLAIVTQLWRRSAHDIIGDAAQAATR
ncbi:hypothetical protein [Acidiphilium sp.]|uniref:hypothetical protein n=1 Tax=Acidiphilium sp. TaxID=527 RepID=UPI00258C269E|nr:hypothetical protein [Acidiphilium sp.]